MNAVERNAPCPCGSGKKYKKCCMGKAAPAAALGPRLQLAEQHHRAGRLAEAENLYRQILHDDPGNHQALHRLGLLAHQLGYHQRAVELLEEACRLQPSDATLHSDLGMILQEQGRHDAAASCYRAALALCPDYATWSDLGQTLYHLGRFGEAEAACREALRLKPDNVGACNNLGLALMELGRAEESITLFQRVLALQPDLVLGRFNLGTAYEKLNRLDEAAACYRDALAASPDLIQAHHNLGNVLLNQGRIDEALTCFDRALALQPDFAWTYDIRLCALNYLPDRAPAQVYQVCREYAQRIEAPLKRYWQRHANGRDPGRRLKVGYVSADLRFHSAAFFMEPILVHHDHDAVEVYCYYNNTIEDAITARLKRHADHWIPCRYLTDEQLAARIRADGIDILVDLAGHTAGNRLRVFARKPSPVQVSYLGYPATTGLKAMDWRLVTAATDPEGSEAWHSERLYRLPRSLWCYRPPETGAVQTRTPARGAGRITFGSMNNIAKVSDAALKVWSDLLKRLPTARLVLTNLPEGEGKAQITRRFAARGIGSERLVLHGKLSGEAYEAELQKIDIGLDPYPYNGTTTTCQSLWMGIPVISLKGETSVSRSGYALLTTLGLDELVAHDEAEYEKIAVELAQDLDRLDALRAGLRSRMEASVLRDEAGFTKDLEAAYRDMWRQWCAQPPATAADFRPGSDPDPNGDPEASYRAGLSHLQSGRPKEAAVLFESVLARLPENFHALHMLGVAALHDGRPDDALRYLDEALRIDPGEAGAHYNRGLTLQALKRPEEALASYERAVVLRPEFVDAWNNRGLMLRDLGRLDAAAASYRRALTLRPEGVDVLNNLGNILRDLDRFDEAWTCFDRALALRPGYATGHNNRGTVLQAQCRFEAALPHHLHAQALDPMNVEAHWNEGLCRLTLGDLRTGFGKFEWRWKKSEFEGMRKVFPQLPWLGREDVAGKTVLLWAEQGLGDVLQFCRYVPAVTARGARIVLGLQPALKRLLSRLPGVAQLAGSGEAMPGYDYHCPLMSLPLVFGTTLETIPAAVPYLYADEAKVAEWRARLGPARTRRIGLAWSGNPEHKNDRNRSIALAALAPLLEVEAEFISVQKEVRASDQALLETCGIRHYGEFLEDFEDTAALLMCVDLVITVDTAVAHLAGALGRPVWILLPYAPDWRWLLGREDSPWYPTARLFRQPALGEWDDPLRRVAAELAR